MNTQAENNYWADKQHMLPIETLKPRIMKDGDKWCCLYGDNLQEGIAGFGDTPNMAMQEFLKALNKN